MSGQILYSDGLLERLDVSSTQEALVIFKMEDLEMPGLFQALDIKDNELHILGIFDKNVQVFKIHEYKRLTAIIKYNNNNTRINLAIDSIKIVNKMGSLVLGVGAKEYEIETF